MNDLTIHWHGHCTRRINNPVLILLGDLLVLDGDHPVAVDSLDMPACNTHIDRSDMTIGHQFGFFHRFFNGLDRAFDIDDHTLAQSL